MDRPAAGGFLGLTAASPLRVVVSPRGAASRPRFKGFRRLWWRSSGAIIMAASRPKTFTTGLRPMANHTTAPAARWKCTPFGAVHHFPRRGKFSCRSAFEFISNSRYSAARISPSGGDVAVGDRRGAFPRAKPGCMVCRSYRHKHKLTQKPSAHSAPALAGKGGGASHQRGLPECYLEIVTQRACILQLNWPPTVATPYPAPPDFSTGKRLTCHPYSGGRINLSMLSIHAKCLHCPAPHCPGGKRSAVSGRRFHSQSKIPAPFFKGAGFFIV